MSLREFLVKSAVGAACSAVLTLCGAVIVSNREDAVQDSRLHTVEAHESETDNTLRELNKNVQMLDQDVAVLNERLKSGPGKSR